MMKTLKFVWMMTGVVFATLLFQSCMDDEGYSLGEFQVNLATVETDGSNTSQYFRLDDGTTLWPAAGYYVGQNMEARQRVLLNYTILSDSLSNFSHYIKVNDLDLVLTKPIAEDKFNENDSIYGTDPVEIKEIWVGSSFLNVFFTAYYGGHTKHFINLVKIDRDTAEDGSYHLEFRHNAYDDPQLTIATGPVCFDLNSLAPNAGEKVKLTVSVRTSEGSKTYTFEYDPSKQQNPGEKEISQLGTGFATNLE